MTNGRSLAALLLLGVLTLGTGPTAFAQSGTLQQRLAKTTSLACTFSLMATGGWKDGVPAADVKPATVKVAFTNINADEGTANVEGGFVGGYVAVRYVNDYLHLMQMYGSGPLHTTTVFAKATKDGRVMAVHTRHEYTDVILPGFTSRPEMYLGECTLGN